MCIRDRANPTFSGPTSVSAGTLQAGDNAAFGTSAITISGTGTLDLNGKTLANNITLTAGTLTGGTISASQLTLTNGTIAAILGSGALTKSTAGSVTLAGANTFTGGTTLSAGTLVVGATDALPGSIPIGGGHLSLGSFNNAAGAVSFCLLYTSDAADE